MATLPKELVGLHRFVTKNGKVILESNGIEALELDYIRFFDDPNGVLRASCSMISFPNGHRKETPVDIFIRSFEFKDLQLCVSGKELITESSFSVSIGFQPWGNKGWRAVGMVKSKSINISNKDLGSLLTELIKGIV